MRAWNLGRGGFDEHGNVRNWLQYDRVEIWGTLGIGFAAIILIDLLYFFNPPPPSFGNFKSR
jgi:hypothetical protein